MAVPVYDISKAAFEIWKGNKMKRLVYTIIQDYNRRFIWKLGIIFLFFVQIINNPLP